MATRKVTRRLGNENTASLGQSRLGAKEEDKPVKRTLRSAAPSNYGALASKTTNKSLATGIDGKAGKLVSKSKFTTIETTEARPIKGLRGVSKNALASKTSNIARPVATDSSKSLLPAKKIAGGKRIVVKDESEQIGQDEEQEEQHAVSDESDVEVEQNPKKKQKIAAEELPKDFGWEDLDAGDEEDPMMVTEYVGECYEYLRELELQTLPSSTYMDTLQSEVTWRMRGILMDWIIELHVKFRLLPETIFLAANIIDRFCSLREVAVVKYQLMGVTALFIASKYEEIICPSMANFLFMTDGGYTDEEFLKAERYVLQIIGWDLSYPNPINFLRRISKADNYDIQSRTIAKYLMEISVVNHKLLGRKPSEIAAAAAWLARNILDRGVWDANCIHYSGYTQDELIDCAQIMFDFVVKSIHIGDESECPNFHKKYASKKFYKASLVVKDWVQENYLCSKEAQRKIRMYQRKAAAAVMSPAGSNSVLGPTDDDIWQADVLVPEAL